MRSFLFNKKSHNFLLNKAPQGCAGVRAMKVLLRKRTPRESLQANSLFVKSVFVNIIKKIVKKLLKNNNSLLCVVILEYNGKVKK